jgi:hypothetical protein
MTTPTISTEPLVPDEDQDEDQQEDQQEEEEDIFDDARSEMLIATMVFAIVRRTRRIRPHLKKQHQKNVK